MIHAWIFNRAVKRVLRPALPSHRIRKILDLTEGEYKKLPKSDRKETLGMSFIIATCQRNIAFYQSTLQSGISEQDAKLHIENINWEITQLLGSPMWHLSITRGLNSISRIYWIDKVLWGLLFTRPFERVFTSSDADLSFDVVTCPIQAYYKSQGHPDLCYHAACVQDYRLADRWHADFTRTQTLASGAKSCDFKFYVSKDQRV
ncbi:MAG: L-2-amino-thiazoline-4-carboxylic acid hydrolase [Ketobacter sp.]